MQALLMRGWPITGLYAGGAKRLFDLTLVIFFAPLWLPLLGALWALSWLEAGQGFYLDQRVGRNGRSFRCLKIRTMVRGALRGCAAQKLRRDPRVTPMGRFLRRSSLDELPQLICVLKGEMSLVGPRPVPASELARYGALQAHYLSVRPGLTGLWQTSGRNALSYADRIALDVAYVQSLTLLQDLRILRATCHEIWRMSGR